MAFSQRYDKQDSLSDMGHFTDWINVSDCYYSSPRDTKDISREQLTGNEYPTLIDIGSQAPRDIQNLHIMGNVTGNAYIDFVREWDELHSKYENSIAAISRAYPNPSRIHEYRQMPFGWAPSTLERKNFTNDKIEEELKEASYITKLDYNWDDEGAKKIDENLFEMTKKFLRDYSDYLYNNYFLVLSAPEINPCSDGTIDLSWRAKNAQMLINIRIFKDLPHAFYYGDHYYDRKPIKGNVALNEFSESLAVFMKQLT